MQKELGIRLAPIIGGDGTIKKPWRRKLLGKLMATLPSNTATEEEKAKHLERQLHFLSGRFPMTSTATVRMQSAAWEDAITEAKTKPYGEVVARLEDIAEDIHSAVVDEPDGECGEDGLGPEDPPPSSPLPEGTSNTTTSTSSISPINSSAEPPTMCPFDPVVAPQGGNEGEC